MVGSFVCNRKAQNVFSAILIILGIVILYEYRTPLKENIIADRQYTDSRLQLENSSNRTKVLIFTAFRSGSSFTGAMFSANPDIFYMFEPLKVYIGEKEGIGCMNEPLACRLQYLFDCEIHKYFKEAEIFNPGDKAERDRQTWYRRIFASEERDHEIKASTSDLDKLCSSLYKHVSAKIIRGKTLESVVPLMEQGVKILYVLRDPRGLINSRRTFGNKIPRTDSKLISSMTAECKKNDINLEFIKTISTDSKLGALFQNNFRVMRYDDLASDLSYFTHKVYDFLELEMPESIKNFTNSNPRVRVWGKVKLEKPKEDSSTQVELAKWQTGLTYNVVDTVQQLCKFTMDSLGYNYINSNQEMTQPFQSMSEIPQDLPFSIK